MTMTESTVTYKMVVTSLLGLLYVAQYNEADTMLPAELLDERQTLVEATMSSAYSSFDTTDCLDLATVDWLGDSSLVK